MPTPAVNGDASISHFTAGTRQPYSTEAPAIRAIPCLTPPPRCGVKPMSFISTNASTNITTSTTPRRTNGTPRFVAWAM